MVRSQISENEVEIIWNALGPILIKRCSVEVVSAGTGTRGKRTRDSAR